MGGTPEYHKEGLPDLGSTVFTEHPENIARARVLFASGKYSESDLASLFGVSPRALSQAVNMTWQEWEQYIRIPLSALLIEAAFSPTLDLPSVRQIDLGDAGRIAEDVLTRSKPESMGFRERGKVFYIDSKTMNVSVEPAGDRDYVGKSGKINAPLRKDRLLGVVPLFRKPKRRRAALSLHCHDIPKSLPGHTDITSLLYTVNEPTALPAILVINPVEKVLVTRSKDSHPQGDRRSIDYEADWQNVLLEEKLLKILSSKPRKAEFIEKQRAILEEYYRNKVSNQYRLQVYTCPISENVVRVQEWLKEIRV